VGDDLGAQLDCAVADMLSAGRKITGIALPSAVIFVYRQVHDGSRRATRSEALALVASTPAEEGRLFARIKVNIAVLHPPRASVS
jgi:hypothetical protein